MIQFNIIIYSQAQDMKENPLKVDKLEKFDERLGNLTKN